MPTYEFVCPDGHAFEKFYRTISGAPSEVACPVCGRNAARQISGGAGLVFKGSGFYITDYGKDGKKKPSAGKPADTPKTSSGSESAAASDAPKPAPPSTPAKSSDE